MKNALKILLLISIFIVVFIYHESISNYIVEKVVFSKKIVLNPPNNYTNNYNFEYVQTTTDFIADNKQEILNIIYTALNNGYDEFYFYCHYENCNNDFNDIIASKDLIINNYISPFNSYRKLIISKELFGKIKINIEKSYVSSDINYVNEKLDQIIAEIINDKMTDKEKIISFHNYIIDHTVYDLEYIKNNLNDIDHPSHKAAGLLFFGKALCGGYSEVMAIFLDRLNIPNYRISSEDYIWNFVYLNGNWYHLDLTWDDPVTSDGSNLRLDTYLFITTNELENLNVLSHTYDKTIYPEAK